MKEGKLLNYPTCCDRKAIEIWLAGRSEQAVRHPKSGFCEDCLPSFQLRHIRAGTCSNPDIQFRIDADGFLSGFVPTHCTKRHAIGVDQ